MQHQYNCLNNNIICINTICIVINFLIKSEDIYFSKLEITFGYDC